MARKFQNVFRLAVVVNGTVVETLTSKLSGRRKIIIGKQPGSNLFVPHPELPKQYKVAVLNKNHVDFYPLEGWRGYVDTKSGYVTLPHVGLQALEMGVGGTAHLFHNGVDIMAKVVKERAPLAVSGYGLGWFGLFSESRNETQALGVGAIASTVLLFLMLGLAFLQTPAKYEGIEALADRELMHLVHPDFLETAPEALQYRLDRVNMVNQIATYYIQLLHLHMDWPRERGFELTYPSTVERYAEKYSQLRLLHQAYVDATDDRKLASSLDEKAIAIPAIVGNSFEEQVARFVDKAELLKESFRSNLEARRVLTENYNEDPDYYWKSYVEGEKKVHSMSALAAISVFKQKTNEEAMYYDAMVLAYKAKKLQLVDSKESTGTDFAHPVFLSSAARELVLSNYPQDFTEDGALRLGNASFVELDTGRLIEPKVAKITDKSISQFISTKKTDIRRCYEKSLRSNPYLRGSTSWQWVVDSRGSPTDIVAVASTIRQEELLICIRATISAWSFPKPDFGSVVINQTFQFTPNEKK